MNMLEVVRSGECGGSLLSLLVMGRGEVVFWA